VHSELAVLVALAEFLLPVQFGQAELVPLVLLVLVLDRQLDLFLALDWRLLDCCYPYNSYLNNLKLLY
jgi:hypothetical protein